MQLNKLKTILLLFLATQGILSCRINSETQRFPRTMFWAWERNEDLRFIDPKKIGVAYLAQTINLTSEKTILVPRRQPLKINANTFLIAVTRIETYRAVSEFSANQLDETAKLIIESSLRENIKGIQIDFDVKVSERDFYKNLLVRIRKNLAKDKTLSITALASFCIGDRWMQDLPIDEAVPMLFEMGPDSRQISKQLIGGKDFAEPLCKMSYGSAIYEPHNINFKEHRTRFFFNSKPWKASDLERLK